MGVSVDNPLDPHLPDFARMCNILGPSNISKRCCSILFIKSWHMMIDMRDDHDVTIP